MSFHLKSDPTAPVQYELIAEEVNEIYPELVIHDAAGTIQDVRYDEGLAIVAEGSAQQQRRELADVAQLRQHAAELKKMNETMQAALVELQNPRQRIAMR